MPVPMVSQPPIFSDDWLRGARAKRTNASWAAVAIETLDTTGQIYLSTLRLWFERFPLNLKQKQGLRVRLESFRNDEHLGGVNELAWWAFMLRESLTATPLPPATAPRPDFQLQLPADCFVEVSTLNVSEKDKTKFEAEESVALDHAETIRRVVGKLTAEKQLQLKYAADHNKPSVLALFDYTTWSGFGTLFFRTLGEFPAWEAVRLQVLPARVVSDRLFGTQGARWPNRPKPSSLCSVLQPIGATSLAARYVFVSQSVLVAARLR
jgi:hypothetical protein